MRTRNVVVVTVGLLVALVLTVTGDGRWECLTAWRQD